VDTFFAVFLGILLLSQVVQATWLLSALRRIAGNDMNLKAFAASEIAEFKKRTAVLETAWDDVYAKMRKVIGRADKIHAIENPPERRDDASLSEAEQKAELWRRLREVKRGAG